MTDEGNMDQIKGKVKEVTGDVTGDNKKKAEGFLDQTVGKVKKVADDAKEKMDSAVKDIKDKF